VEREALTGGMASYRAIVRLLHLREDDA